MRAAVLTAAGGTPEAGDFDDPTPGDGQAVLEVGAAGANPFDVVVASGAMGEPPLPSIVGREAVGRLEDGRRVYTGSPISPYGTWAERTLIDPSKAFDVPDGLDDALAVSVGIAGLAAWLSLEWQAKLQPGETVLVLGATGMVGQIAIQAARILGAGRVVGAARNAEALERLGTTTVTMGGGDDVAALEDAAGEGFDVVIDPLYGAPLAAALEATAPGARLVSIGAGAGATAEIGLSSLAGRTHIGHGTQFVPREVQRAAYGRLTAHAAAGEIEVEIERYPLERAADAWRALSAGSQHHKIAVEP